jgi:integrase
LLTTYAIPALANRKAEAVTRAEVARLHDQLKDKPYQANRLLAVIGSLYTFAERRGLVPESRNPAKKIEKFPEERRERFLTPEELERLGSAIREGETVGIAWREDGTAPKSKHLAKEENQRTLLSPDAGAALRLLLFTGARLREILHLRWEHVDLGRGLLLLPDSKTGRKTIVLNRPALEILQAHPRTGTYVISGTHPDRPRTDLKKPWSAVCRRAGSKAFGCTTCGTRLRRLARERVWAFRPSASSSVIRKRRRPPATPIWTRIRCSAQRT